jgi:hypothetical protein
LTKDPTFNLEGFEMILIWSSWLEIIFMRIDNCMWRLLRGGLSVFKYKWRGNKNIYLLRWWAERALVKDDLTLKPEWTYSLCAKWFYRVNPINSQQ